MWAGFLLAALKSAESHLGECSFHPALADRKVRLRWPWRLLLPQHALAHLVACLENGRPVPVDDVASTWGVAHVGIELTDDLEAFDVLAVPAHHRLGVVGHDLFLRQNSTQKSAGRKMKT
jgi:hypothetical protein